MDEFERLKAEGQTMQRNAWADWSDRPLEERMNWNVRAAEFLQSGRATKEQIDTLGPLIDGAGAGGQDLRRQGLNWSIFRDTPSDTIRGQRRAKPVVDAVKAVTDALKEGLPDMGQIAVMIGVLIFVIALTAD